MVKAIEATGIPVVHICTIVPAVAIPHPLGNPNLSKEDEKKLRRTLVERALKALSTPVDSQTVFEN